MEKNEEICNSNEINEIEKGIIFYILPENRLIYTKPEKMGGGYDYVFLCEPHPIELPHGVKLKIDSNIFIAVSKWINKEELEKIPEFKPLTKNLPYGTIAQMSMVLPLNLKMILKFSFRTNVK